MSVSSDEQEAWQEYLQETRDLSPERYQEIEPWAWSKLNKRLLTIFKKKPRKAA